MVSELCPAVRRLAPSKLGDSPTLCSSRSTQVGGLATAIQTTTPILIRDSTFPQRFPAYSLGSFQQSHERMRTSPLPTTFRLSPTPRGSTSLPSKSEAPACTRSLRSESSAARSYGL